MAKRSNDNLARAHHVQQWHGPDSAFRRGHSAPRSPRIGMLNGLVVLPGAGSGAWLDLAVPVLRSAAPEPQGRPTEPHCEVTICATRRGPGPDPPVPPNCAWAPARRIGRTRPDLAGSLVGVDRDLGLGDRAAGQLRPRAGIV